MTQEGYLIEFPDAGPYLFPELAEPSAASYLPEHDVMLLQFDKLILPLNRVGTQAVIDALLEPKPAADNTSYEGHHPVPLEDMDKDSVVETPLLAKGPATAVQHANLIVLNVMLGEARAALPLSVAAAASVGQILSQMPEEEG